MADDFRIEVQDLRDLARDLKGLEPKLDKQLQKTNKAAADTVAQEARNNYGHSGGPGSASIRALATQTKAQVALGSARAPYVIGQEFGSGQGLHKKQFPPYNSGAGNFFYPAIRAEAKNLPDTYGQMLESLLSSAGFN